MESFLAVSPPAWNVDVPGPGVGPGGGSPPFDDEDYEDEEDEEDEIPDSNFAVLDTSLPGHGDGTLLCCWGCACLHWSEI